LTDNKLDPNFLSEDDLGLKSMLNGGDLIHGSCLKTVKSEDASTYYFGEVEDAFPHGYGVRLNSWDVVEHGMF
jgi:hypothetical protein